MTDPVDALLHSAHDDERDERDEPHDGVVVLAPPNTTLGGSAASIGLNPGAFGAVPFAAIIDHSDENIRVNDENDDEPVLNDNTRHP